MSDAARAVLLGLPRSGKSTYLAALWHLLEADDRPSGLSLAGLEGDASYLNEIREQWYTYAALDRTALGTPGKASLRIAGLGPEEVTLQIPDYNGELFRDAFSERGWSSEFDQALTAADGVLLFIDPNSARPTVRIDELPRRTKSRATPAAVSDPTPSPTWAADGVAAQTKLVDLLQMAGRSCESLRLAVVVSAWDLVQQEGVPPNEWLERRMPLLAQFLDSNSDTVASRAFGVSAQGGDYASELATIQSRDASDRPIVVDDLGATTHDVTLPVRWLLSRE